eukprot:TRINITY_DN6607_c0_g1_i1.p1 TRINITY_DN6607_c0_g1~~TRINITY_DN6607_c0_g1_i1.p1  ORF type:complete len:1058 (+),score=263.06 TRINITY_DN6607_c0_g1_i1:165-3338(+)
MGKSKKKGRGGGGGAEDLRPDPDHPSGPLYSFADFLAYYPTEREARRRWDQAGAVVERSGMGRGSAVAAAKPRMTVAAGATGAEQPHRPAAASWGGPAAPLHVQPPAPPPQQQPQQQQEAYLLDPAAPPPPPAFPPPPSPPSDPGITPPAPEPPPPPSPSTPPRPRPPTPPQEQPPREEDLGVSYEDEELQRRISSWRENEVDARQRQQLVSLLAYSAQQAVFWYRYHILSRRHSPDNAESHCQVLWTGSVSLGVQLRGDDTDLVLVCARGITVSEFFGPVRSHLTSILRERLEKDPQVRAYMPDIPQVLAKPDARPPLMTLLAGGQYVDITPVEVPLDELPLYPSFSAALNSNGSRIFAEFGGPRGPCGGLGGPLDAGFIASKCPERDMPRLQTVLRGLKIWARMRGVYGAKYGLFNGIGCAVLAARACRTKPAWGAARVLQWLLADLAAHFAAAEQGMYTAGAPSPRPPCAPIALTPWPYVVYGGQWWEKEERGGTVRMVDRGPNPPPRCPAELLQTYGMGRSPRVRVQPLAHLVTIMTPSGSNALYNAPPCAAQAMAAETERARRIFAQSPGDWATVMEPFRFFSSYKRFVQFEIRARRQPLLECWAGFLESRVRSLAHLLSTWAAGHAQPYEATVRPWPRVYRSDRAAAHSVSAPGRGQPAARCAAYLFFGLDTSADRDDSEVSAMVRKQEAADIVERAAEFIEQEWASSWGEMRSQLETSEGVMPMKYGGRMLLRPRVSVVRRERLPRFVLDQEADLCGDSEPLYSVYQECSRRTVQVVPMRVQSHYKRHSGGIRLRYLAQSSSDQEGEEHVWAGDGEDDVLHGGDLVHALLAPRDRPAAGADGPSASSRFVWVVSTHSTRRCQGYCRLKYLHPVQPEGGSSPIQSGGYNMKVSPFSGAPIREEPHGGPPIRWLLPGERVAVIRRPVGRFSAKAVADSDPDAASEADDGDAVYVSAELGGDGWVDLCELQVASDDEDDDVSGLGSESDSESDDSRDDDDDEGGVLTPAYPGGPSGPSEPPGVDTPGAPEAADGRSPAKVPFPSCPEVLAPSG